MGHALLFCEALRQLRTVVEALLRQYDNGKRHYAVEEDRTVFTACTFSSNRSRRALRLRDA